MCDFIYYLLVLWNSFYSSHWYECEDEARSEK